MKLLSLTILTVLFYSNTSNANIAGNITAIKKLNSAINSPTISAEDFSQVTEKSDSRGKFIKK